MRNESNYFLSWGNFKAEEANEMLRKVLVLVRLCQFRHVLWVGENPRGSKAFRIFDFRKEVEDLSSSRLPPFWERSATRILNR